MRVSWDYFDLLGVRPALGRTFRQEDDHPDRWRVLVLSDGLWRRRFDADPSVIGRTIRMNDRDSRSSASMPAGFEDVISASVLPARGALGAARLRRDAVRTPAAAAGTCGRSAGCGRA